MTGYFVASQNAIDRQCFFLATSIYSIESASLTSHGALDQVEAQIDLPRVRRRVGRAQVVADSLNQSDPTQAPSQTAPRFCEL